MRQIQKQKPDLVVLATRWRHGLPLWLKPSIAQAIARRTNAMTLFVPRGCHGIVSVGGVIRLRRVLLPIDHKPNAQEAVIRAVRAAEAFGDETVEIVLIHVNGDALPQFNRPESEACVWKELWHSDVVRVILDAANEADLIVMATEGRHGIFDALRGTAATERVVRGAPCPVLAVGAK